MSTIKKNILANLVGKVWVGAITLALLPVYLMFLGAEAYGLVGFYMSLSAALAILDLGLYTTLARELARRSAQDQAREGMRNLLRSTEAIHWGIAALIGFALIAGAPLIARYWLKSETLPPEALQDALRLMGLTIALQWPSALYTAGLSGLQLQVSLNVASGIVATLRGAGAVLVLWRVSPSPQAFFAWQVFGGLLVTATLGVLLWRSLALEGHRPRFDVDLLRSLWRYSFGAWGMGFSATLLVQIDKIVLSAVLPLASFGYYSIASIVSNSLYYLLAPITSSMFPRFAQLGSADSRRELAQTYHKSCQVVAVTTLPWAILVALFPSEILSLWTQNVQVAREGHVVLSLLMAGTALNALVQLPYYLQLAAGRVRLGLYANLITTIISVPFLIVLANRYGAPGGAAAWLLLHFSHFAIVAPLMHRFVPQVETWRWYLIDTLPPLGACVLLLGLAYQAMPESLSGFASAGYLGLALAIAYIGAIFASPDGRRWALGWIKRAREGKSK